MTEAVLDATYESPYGAFRFNYPSPWHIEKVEGQLLLYNKDNKVGALMVSAHMVPKEQVMGAGAHLYQYLVDKKINPDPHKMVVWTDHDTGHQAASYAFEAEDDTYWRVFFSVLGPKVVLMTYQCGHGGWGEEMGVVESIVQSISF